MKDLIKVLQVIRNMITNADKISNIEKQLNIFYFLYKGYVWSIWEWSSSDDTDNEGYSLAYYPGAKNVSDIITPKIHRDFMVYSSGDFNTVDTLNLYAQLYNIIKEKFYGVDKVFNDILND